MFGRKKKPPDATTGTNLRCSFCNKSQRDVKKLIVGPNVFICDECVDICLDIIAEDRKDAPSDVPRGDVPMMTMLSVCALCHLPTTVDQSILVGESGLLCAGCTAAVEVALAQASRPN